MDLDVDTNNDNGFSFQGFNDSEDRIEASEMLDANGSKRPGKIVLDTSHTNSDGDSVPDFADGFNLPLSGQIDELTHVTSSLKFVPVQVTLKEPFDTANAMVEFEYGPVSQPEISVNGIGYTGSGTPEDPFVLKLNKGGIRLWKTMATERVSGEDVPAGDFIPPGQKIKWSDISAESESRIAQLYLEYVDTTPPQAAGRKKITVTATEGYVLTEDKVNVTLLPVQIVVTDITGFRGLGDTPAASVPRIPANTEPNGIACDWQENVNDGAMLLVRVVGPENYSFSSSFGRNDPEFIPGLPTAPARDGEYLAVSGTDKAALQSLGISVKDEVYDSGRVVYDMTIYKSPTEFDLANPLNPAKERDLKMAAKISSNGGISATEVVLEKQVTLTRPPVVTVHGVNSNPDVWDPFCNKFEDWGFVCKDKDDFRVDHSGTDATRSSEGKTWGFGEISTTCSKVSEKVATAAETFRNGKYFSHKRIAVQKVDIVAHSYGGLLARWYTEMSGASKGEEFSNRRNVRKLVTLGTPHKGSPLANMVCEVFKNPLIANASSEGVGSLEFSMSNLLSYLDIDNTGMLPNALTTARVEPRHAYEVFSVNSERLHDLNSNPLHDDIGYAAISGTKETLYAVVDFGSLVPNRDTFTPGDAKPYFPWIDLFRRDGIDIDGTDAIVPKWSSKISAVAADYLEVNKNHIELPNDDDVLNKCREWLNRSIARGVSHRPTWVHVPVSERNAYVGSTIDAGGRSVGGGLRPTAIVKVELSPGSSSPLTISTTAASVGIKGAPLTGMITASSIATEEFKLISDEALDNVLSIASLASLLIDAGDMNGAAGGNYVAFEVKNVKFGRKYSNVATGPNGESDSTDTILIGYELQGEPGQSPPTELILPNYTLDAPVKTGLSLQLSGAIDVSGAGSGSQVVETRVYDSDLGIDTHLETKTFELMHPQGAWNGVLIPYSTDVTLGLNAVGHVVGSLGDSGEDQPEVYQYLIRPGTASNPSSATILVP